MKTIINLTPHEVKVVKAECIKVYPASGNVARVATNSVKVGEVDGVSLFKTVYVDPEGVPEPKENVLYIVSGLVRTSYPNRTDLISPHGLIRDDEGRVIGCEGFDVN